MVGLVVTLAPKAGPGVWVELRESLTAAMGAWKKNVCAFEKRQLATRSKRKMS